ncbi:MAG: molybdopterin dinucleotide binding domain-containing protein [Terrimicrobiaceae bacterium]
MPNDITGIRDYRMIDECGGIQWPLTETDVLKGLAPDGMPSERRLFEDGRFFTPNGRARFLFEDPRKAPELPDEHYPFILLTGRGTSSQWHTNTRTAKSDVLRKLYPRECYVEINPGDALRLGIKNTRWLKYRLAVPGFLREHLSHLPFNWASSSSRCTMAK